jgi:hypothetical protein
MQLRSGLWSATALAIALSVAASGPAAAALDDFTGAWLRDGRTNRNIERIDIRREGNQLYVRVNAKCGANVCDWGEVPLHPYGPDARVPVESGASVGLVEYDQDNIGEMLLLRPQGGRINIEIFSNFSDAPKHNNYNGTWSMKRLVP